MQSIPGLGHLVLNTQPGGGFNALGISPFSSIASDLFSGSIEGIEDNNALVYECLWFLNNSDIDYAVYGDNIFNWFSI